MLDKTPIIIISGPTASGKTRLSLSLAKEYDSFIINADSVQVFRDLPILTAQPTHEEKAIFPHFLFGYLSATSDINVNSWLKECLNSIKEARYQKKIPFLVGGTGFYLKSLIDGINTIDNIRADVKHYCKFLYEKIGLKGLYNHLIQLDPLVKNKIHENDSHRIMRAFEVIMSSNKSIIEWQNMQKKPFFHNDSFLYIFISPQKPILQKNCNDRFVQMVEQGAINEVKNLYNIIGNNSYNITKAHGYKEIVKYLNNEWDLNSAIIKSQEVTRQYTKRQITWFKHQVKNGYYIEYENFDSLVLKTNKLIKEFLKNF